MARHGCGQEVRWVSVAGMSVPVEPTPHSAGTVAVSTRRDFIIGYRLGSGQPPAVGYTRHREHECPELGGAA